MTEPVRIGFVGCGSVMQNCYMPLAKQLEMRGVANVVAACDILEDRRALVQDKFGITNFTTDYQQLVSRDDVDLVVVTTSMPAHGPIAKAGLAAGKHVLVEKPMAVELDQAAELVEMAKTSAGYLVPAPHVMLSPTYQTIWKRVHRGEIGKVLSARAFYGWAGPSWGKWFYEPGGGSLFDLGVYNVVSLTGLLGPVKRVVAMAGIAIPERVVDNEMTTVNAVDNAHVLLDWGEGVSAVVTTGFTIQQYKVPGIELYGSTGVIYMNGEDWDPNGYDLWQNDAGCWQQYNETDPNWPWTDGLRHLVECIQTGQRPIITPEHGYHVLEIMLKAQESGRDGQAKMLDSTFTPPSFGLEIEQHAAHLVHDAGRTT